MPNPKVRFKREDRTEFPGWKNKKLSSVSSRVVRKNKGNISDVPLTIASLYGLVDQREYFKKTIASQNMEGYYLINNGEFAYNRSYSKGYDFGAIKRLDKYKCGALSTLYICFALSDCVDSNFMVQYFDSQKWNKEVSIRCAEGARNHGLLNISTDDFFDIEMLLPEAVEEQQKIADFLSAVDEVIAQTEAEVQNLEQQKKAAMQKIFSQEVRFKREDGTEFPKWEEKAVGDFCSVSTGKSNTQDKIDTGNFPFYVRSPIIECSDKYLFDEEAVITVGDGVGTGKVFHYVNGKYNLHQRCYRMYEFTNVIAKFFYYIFSEKFYRRIKAMSAKTSVDSVRMEMITGMNLDIPSFEEQQKIADFLSAFDDAITYAKQELEKWKELKKGLLQKMFV